MLFWLGQRNQCDGGRTRIEPRCDFLYTWAPVLLCCWRLQWGHSDCSTAHVVSPTLARPVLPHLAIRMCRPASDNLSLNLLSSRFWTMSLCLWVWWLVTVGTLTLTWLPTELLDIRVENPFFNTASQVSGQGPWPVRWCGQMCRVPWTFFLPGADMQSTKISSATDLWSSKMVNTSVSSSQSQEEWATVLFNSIGIEDELKLKLCKGHLQTCRPWICASVNQTGHWRIIHIPLQSSTSSTFNFSFISNLTQTWQNNVWTKKI